MRKDALRMKSGRVLYYWTIEDDGVHFTYETRASDDSPLAMDVETKFTMPTSDYQRLYAEFGIEPSVSIREALEEITNSGRGRKLDDAFGNSIAIVDKFVWMN